jgi:predicted phosphoribosyltransferase
MEKSIFFLTGKSPESKDDYFPDWGELIMLDRIKNREEGGKLLAVSLRAYKNSPEAVVLALPRGGVPVGYEVATALNLPLYAFMVRKLGVLERDELAFGAIASGGIIVLNEMVIDSFKIPLKVIESVIARERAELERREKVYRQKSPEINLQGRTVIIADDGLATGATMRAALGAVSKSNPKKIIVAVPVASEEACDGIGHTYGCPCVCLLTREPFYGVGRWYQDFQPTSDGEVCHLLEETAVNMKRRNLQTRWAA